MTDIWATRPGLDSREKQKSKTPRAKSARGAPKIHFNDQYLGHPPFRPIPDVYPEMKEGRLSD
jgi:hypothetical protein